MKRHAVPCELCRHLLTGVCARCRRPACLTCDQCHGCGKILCEPCNTEQPEGRDYAFPGDAYYHPHIRP